MVRRPTRLAEIYRKEKESGGGVFSAIGKRTVEKLDPRNFFNQSGILPLLLPSLFKAYRAVDNKKVEAEKYKTIRSIHSHLNVIRIDTKITAKNTMVLPAMARDMNMIRKGLLAAFKQIGIRSREAPDDYFTNAARRERQYEEQFKKENLNLEPKTAQPTAIKNEKGLLGSLFKDAGLATALTGIVLGGLFSGSAFASSSDWINEPKNQEKIGNFFSWILDTIKGGLSILGDLGSYLMQFSSDWINDPKNQETIGNFFSWIIDTISKGLSVLGDLGTVLLKEFGREDSAFRKSIDSMLESIWTFVKENPILGLVGALTAFSKLLPELTTALLLANSGIAKGIGKLGLIGAAFSFGEWIGTIVREYGESLGKKEELKENYEKMLAEISQIQDAGLKQEILDTIAEKAENRFAITKSIEDARAGLQRYTEVVYNEYKDKIEKERNDRAAKEAEAKSMPKEPTLAPAQPQTIPATVGMGPNLDGTEVIPESKPVKIEPKPKKPQDIPTPLGPNLDGTEGITESPTKVPSVSNKTITTITSDMSLSDFIAAKESRGDYNIYNTGSAKGSKIKHEDFSNMTLNELMRRQSLPPGNPDKIFAAGKYQITTNTMIDTVKNMKLSGNEKFTPELQDRMFVEYLAASRRPDLENFIKGKEGSNIDAAELAMGQEWAVIGVKALGEKSVHEGKGTNKALVSSEQGRNALMVATQRYAEAIAAGKSEDDAYREALLGTSITSSIAQQSTTSPTPQPNAKQEVSNATLAKQTGNQPTSEPNSDLNRQLTNAILYGEGVNAQRNLVQKFRTMDRRLLNQPRIDGARINNVSSEWLDAIKKASPPIVNVVNTPAPPKAPPTTPTDAKPQYNDGVIDREFIKLLVGRTVDNFTVAV